MKIALVITICSVMGCLPPLSHSDWTFETEEECMYKGYYHIAEVAESYMKTIGIEEFKRQQARMLYNCLPADKVFEQAEPSIFETPV
jgi:hypothetical protein